MTKNSVAHGGYHRLRRDQRPSAVLTTRLLYSTTHLVKPVPPLLPEPIITIMETPAADMPAATPTIESPTVRRGLHEDWTASIIGLAIFLSALLLAQSTRPEKFSWDAERPAPLSKEEKTAGKKQESPWAVPLKGWIGKFSTWQKDPTAAFRPKPKKAKAPKPEAAKADAPKTDATQSDATKPAEPTAAATAEVAKTDTPKPETPKPETPKIENPGDYQWRGIVGAFTATLLVGLFASLLQLNSGTQRLQFIPAFIALFALAILSFVLAAQEVLESANLEYALWALLVGLLVANTIGTPKWMMPAVRGELFIKVGLVLLGAEVLFSRLLELGVKGVLVSWLVTPVVLIATYIFGQRVLKMESKSLNLVISADMSVCGVSAAIATAAACKAKKEELSLAIGLSLIFTVIMMIVQPKIIEAVGMPPDVGGAWLGGTIDSTGAVAAAAESKYLGAVGLETAVTVKMIQNILIGVTAIAVAIYWTRWVEPTLGVVDPNAPKVKVGLGEIWRRFPKFVIGFIAASILASWLFAKSYYSEMWYGAAVGGVTKDLRVWLFCLAFVCIGLETNFRELMPYLRSGKAMVLYLCGQALNLTLSLIMALIVFGWLFK